MSLRKGHNLLVDLQPRRVSVVPLPAAGYTGLSNLFGGTAVEAAELAEPEVKQPEVGTPSHYDSNVGAIVSESTDQPAHAKSDMQLMSKTTH